MAVYLDYNATTPIDPRVLEAMMPALEEQFGNPASTTHERGRMAADLADMARDQISSILGRSGHDVIFTSGATEANNMVISTYGLENSRFHEILVGATEHKSILETANHMRREFGLTARTVPVDSNGVTDLVQLEKMLSDNVELVSIMAANSETGVIQPIEHIAKLVHGHGALLHCDVTQAVGKIPFDANKMDIDIATMSSHKIYGPKGCGAIVATREARRQLKPIIFGGGQENNMRSGTLNVPAIVGFGRACEIAIGDGLDDVPRQRALRDDLEKQMIASIDDVTVNGVDAERLPNTSNMRIGGALADAVIVNSPGVEISTGSACSSSAMEPSHVLLAMGLDRTAADESIRMSLGRQTTQDEIDLAVSEIAMAAKFVRKKESEIPERMV